MTSLWLRDLASYGLQVTLIVGAGALLAWLFRLRASAAALIYWQALLGLCLLLPICQPWKRTMSRTAAPQSSLVTPAVNASRALPGTPARDPAPVHWPFGAPIERAVLLVMAAGILARGLWLTAGFRGVARLRSRSGLPSQDLEPLFACARQATRTAAEVEFRIAQRAGSPITFGMRRPVILLPANIAGMAAEAQRAIVYHELIHVRRRDWAWCVAEEFVSAVLWFHPAIWWLIGRIHLVREQVVDRAVIELTASREGYVEALLAVAQANMNARLIPAPLFLKRKLLKKRVAEILKERTMSKRRLILYLALSAAALFIVVRAATSIFPLRVHAQNLSSAPIQVLEGGDNLIHRAAIAYPRRALERRVEGDVTLQVSVDDQGQVSDARVVSGPDELRRSCLGSVLEWHFRAPRPGTAQVTIHFQLPEGGSSSEIVLPAVPEEHGGRGYFVYEPSSADAESRIKELKAKLKDPNTAPLDRAKEELSIAKLKAELEESPHAIVADPPGLAREAAELKAAIEDPATEPEDRAKMKQQLAERLEELAKSRDEGSAFAHVRGEEPVSGQLTAIRTERVPQATLDALSPHLGVRVGDMINQEVASQVRERVRRELGEQFRANFGLKGDGSVELVIVGP